MDDTAFCPECGSPHCATVQAQLRRAEELLGQCLAQTMVTAATMGALEGKLVAFLDESEGQLTVSAGGRARGNA